jgi:hypothetical protein
MKVIVTGDRSWSDIETVASVLSWLPRETVLVEGGCRGLDLIARAVAEELGFSVREYAADWMRYGRSAGVVRNKTMLESEHLLHEPIDLCISFHDDISASKGTRDMVTRIDKAGIKRWHIVH